MGLLEHASRYLRTVRHLAPSQVAHRARLRARARLGRVFPRVRAGAAGPMPPLRRAPMAPTALLRPCSDEVTARRAEQVAGGRFRFLEVERTLGLRPFPPPGDLPLLWVYHLEYMDYLLDLALTGRDDAVLELVKGRLATTTGHRHPYTDSRRAASWLRLLPRAEGGLRGLLSVGAWCWSRRVEASLEYDVGGNHLLENGLALALAGASFRGARAGRLLSVGRRILTEGARTQVLGDGAHYEQSPLYHARVLAVLLEGGLVLDAANTAPPPWFWETLARMVAFLDDVLDPEGNLPLLGDTVREETLEPGRLVRAARDLLPVAVPSPATGDRAYPDTGLYLFEDRREGHRLLLDAGPVCPPRLPAHGQADTFTFELFVGGIAFVVDPGVFGYAAGVMRDYSRATGSHSTVEVDGKDSSEVWSSFRIGRRARVRDARFSLSRKLGTYTGEHDGYARLGVRHRRLVSHVAPGAYLVADSMTGRGEHSYVSRIHLHPETVLEQVDSGWLVHRADRTLRVTPFGAGRTGVESGWCCPEFGVRRPTRVLTLGADGGSACFGYLLSAGEEPAPRVSVEGRSIRIGAHTLRVVP